MSARGVLLFSSVVATLRWDGIKCFLGLRKVFSEDFVVWGDKRIPSSGFWVWEALVATRIKMRF